MNNHFFSILINNKFDTDRKSRKWNYLSNRKAHLKHGEHGTGERTKENGRFVGKEVVTNDGKNGHDNAKNAEGTGNCSEWFQYAFATAARQIQGYDAFYLACEWLDILPGKIDADRALTILRSDENRPKSRITLARARKESSQTAKKLSESQTLVQ